MTASQKKSVKEHVAVITGGSRGIGFALGQNLINKGYKVYSLSRTAPADTKIKHIECDISNETSVKAAFVKLFEKESTIDLLVNNAGIGFSGSIENSDSADIKKIFDVNFFGAVWSARCAIPKMKNGGKIVFISSIAAIFAIPFQSMYSVTKASMSMFSDALRLELMPHKISVSTLLLGDTDTEFTKNNRKVSYDDDEKYAARITRCLNIMEKDEKNGMKTETCAKYITKIVCRKKLKAFYVIGTFMYKMYCILEKFLPKRVVLSLLYQMYGK